LNRAWDLADLWSLSPKGSMAYTKVQPVWKTRVANVLNFRKLFGKNELRNGTAIARLQSIRGSAVESSLFGAERRTFGAK
jgi:hypothetical protein